MIAVLLLGAALAAIGHGAGRDPLTLMRVTHYCPAISRTPPSFATEAIGTFMPPSIPWVHGLDLRDAELADESRRHERAADDNHATACQADPPVVTSWLQADLGAVRRVGPGCLRPAHVMRSALFDLDLTRWAGLANIGAPQVAGGSAFRIPAAGRTCFIRLNFDGAPAILEWTLS